MKTYNLYVLLIAAALLFSCATDDEITTEDSILSHLELTTQETNNESFDTNRVTNISDEELALNMHWMSFIAAETIMGNDLARQDFSNITAEQNYITLENLIGSSASGDFKDAFYLKLSFTIEGIIQNMHCIVDPMNCGAPEPPATSPPLPTGTGPTGAPISVENIPTAEEVIAYLMNYVLNQHCLEIFVPKYIPTTGEIVEIAATQHPMSNATSNEAAILTNEEDPISTHRYIYYDTISPSYIYGIYSLHHYVIITRPKRILTTCDYNEYSRIRFTEFFN